MDISDEIGRLQQKSQTLAKEIYAKLTPWQTALVARHPQRPYTLDYVREIFTDFHELHGDRMYADDQSIIGGLARFNGMPCMVIGHQKGRDTRNAPRATSACPARGLSQGAAPDAPGREIQPARVHLRGHARRLSRHRRRRARQSEAIGHNLYAMAELKVPVIVTIIGEGGSGGALAIAVGNAVLMLQYATYAVISPEGCASILWRSADKAPEAAEALAIIAPRLKDLGLVDRVVNEPVGGAHRDPASWPACAPRAGRRPAPAAGHDARAARGAAHPAPAVLRRLPGSARLIRAGAGLVAGAAAEVHAPRSAMNTPTAPDAMPSARAGWLPFPCAFPGPGRGAATGAGRPARAPAAHGRGRQRRRRFGHAGAACGRHRREQGIDLLLFHVHHGLQDAADAWSEQTRALARLLACRRTRRA